MKKLYLLLLFIIGVNILCAQTTIGLLYHDQSVSNGYVLFGYKQEKELYLINNCGELVNQWTCNHRIGVAYLLEDGTLLKSGENHLELRSWDNVLLWEVDLGVQGIDQHHDIEPLPNGNILVLARDRYTSIEAIENGRNPQTVTNGLVAEKIVEIEPLSNNLFSIVWEWKIWDHLIQEFDSSKQNFGNVATSPRLLDVNLGSSSGNWIHANAIDYNASLDQIVMSSRTMSEIYIIDHSTTTAEASSHFGGSLGKGGDFLWRWGNPGNYGQGSIIDKKLFGQHDPKWIPDGYPNSGKLSVFNNGTERTPEFSSIHIIDSGVNITGDYNLNGSFYPDDFFWSWNGEVLGTTVFSNSQSGFNIQYNGNILFCETVPGRISEIDISGNVLWSYENPIGNLNYSQGDIIPDSYNQVFRAEKYPPDFIGFIGKDLSPKGILENENSISDNCNLLSMNEYSILDQIILYPNPTTEKIKIHSHQGLSAVIVYNLLGSRLLELNPSEIDIEIDFSNYSTGVYLLRFDFANGAKVFKRVVKK